MMISAWLTAKPNPSIHPKYCDGPTLLNPFLSLPSLFLSPVFYTVSLNLEVFGERFKLLQFGNSKAQANVFTQVEIQQNV